MITYTPTEKATLFQELISAEKADCNDPEWHEIPAFSNTGPNVDKALASIGLKPGNLWCMAYQHLKFKEHGLLSYNGVIFVISTGLVQAQVNHCKANGLLISAEAAQKGGIIKPGYLMYQYHPELGRYAHVEMVVSVDDSTKDFETVGGNTTTVKWARNGDRVAAHQRNLYDRQGGHWRYCFSQTH